MRCATTLLWLMRCATTLLWLMMCATTLLWLMRCATTLLWLMRIHWHNLLVTVLLSLFCVNKSVCLNPATRICHGRKTLPACLVVSEKNPTSAMCLAVSGRNPHYRHVSRCLGELPRYRHVSRCLRELLRCPCRRVSRCLWKKSPFCYIRSRLSMTMYLWTVKWLTLKI